MYYVYTKQITGYFGLSVCFGLSVFLNYPSTRVPTIIPNNGATVLILQYTGYDVV
jgi:hypothetical protein